MSVCDDSTLFGPDVSDEPHGVIEEVGDRIQVWSRQFVNRWVFLAHQRPAALRELEELIACHTEILSGNGSRIASGTGGAVAPCGASDADGSSTPHGGAPRVSLDDAMGLSENIIVLPKGRN